MQLKLSNITSGILTAAALLLVGCGGGGDSSPSNPTAQQVNLADAMGFYDSSLKIDLSKTRSISIGNSAKPSAQVKTLDGTRFLVEHYASKLPEFWFTFYLDDHSDEKPHKLEFMINKLGNSIVYGTYYANGTSYMCSDLFTDNAAHCNDKISFKLDLNSTNPLTLNFDDATFIDINAKIKLNGQLKGFTSSRPIFIGNTKKPKSEISVNQQEFPISNINWDYSRRSDGNYFRIFGKNPNGQEIWFVVNDRTLLAKSYYIDLRGDGREEETRKVKTEIKDNKIIINFNELLNPNGAGTITGFIEYQAPRSTLRNEKSSLDLNTTEAFVSHSTFNSVLIKGFVSRPSFGEIDVSILNKKVVAVAYSYPDDKGFYQTVACAPDETPCRGVTVSDDLNTVTFNNTKIGSFNFNGELFSELF